MLDLGEKKRNAVDSGDGVKQELRTAVASSGCRSRRNDSDSTAGVLEAARRKMELSVEDVAAETKIKGDYIVALERGDYSNLPQRIYVLAYIRKLCSLYHLSSEISGELAAPWRDFDYELPENLSRSVDLEPSEENRRLIRQLAVILISSGVLIFLALALGAAMLFINARRSADKSDTPPPINEERLLKLQRAPAVDIVELPPVK